VPRFCQFAYSAGVQLIAHDIFEQMHIESIRQRMKGSQAVEGKVVYAGNKIYVYSCPYNVNLLACCPHTDAGREKQVITINRLRPSGWACTSWKRCNCMWNELCFGKSI